MATHRTGDPIGILTRIPVAAWVCLTVVIVAVLGSFTYLSAIDASTADLRAGMNTVLNLASTLASTLAAIYAGAAAHSSINTENTPNGNGKNETPS